MTWWLVLALTHRSVRVEFIRGPGFGLFANEEIQVGDFIIEYVGEVIDDAECERRLIHSRSHGEVPCNERARDMSWSTSNVVL